MSMEIQLAVQVYAQIFKCVDLFELLAIVFNCYLTNFVQLWVGAEGHYFRFFDVQRAFVFGKPRTKG